MQIDYHIVFYAVFIGGLNANKKAGMAQSDVFTDHFVSACRDRPDN